MANGTPLTTEQLSVLIAEGTFHGIRKLLNQRQLTDAQASEILSRSCGALLQEVNEAKKEMQHIQTALSQLERTCSAGKHARNLRPGDPTNDQIGNAVVNLDNWIVSLMETNLTITGMLNPSLTRNKIREFGIAMNSLMDMRAAQKHPVLDDPNLFSGYVNW